MAHTWPQAVRTALIRLTDAGFTACLVGGCVRDLLSGRQPNDFDLASDARPEQVLDVFRDQTVVKTGLQHGTVLVVLDHVPLEITTFRVDGRYTDRRRPDSVRFTRQVTADLSRRDFTINAMAWPWPQGQTRACFDPADVIDPFGGRTDLEQRLIRCVGQPEQRFDEDALRILRALRFASVLGFQIEAQTAAALRRQADLLQHVARERVFHELMLLLGGRNAGPVVAAFAAVLHVILPVLPSEADRIGQLAGTLARLPGQAVVRLAALLQPAQDPDRIDALLTSLRCDRATRARVLSLTDCRSRLPEPDLPAVKHWLRRCPPDIAREAVRLEQAALQAGREPDRLNLAQLTALDRQIGQITAQDACYRLPDLAVSGADLLQLGCRPGPAVGRLLEHLLDAVIAGRLANRKEDLLREAKNELEAHP
ncbi:MAG: hypothetical protein GX112_06660 [Clostridiaceae bacterium]|nr:hypothetical protein [Clostridiaceae bacterium]